MAGEFWVRKNEMTPTQKVKMPSSCRRKTCHERMSRGSVTKQRTMKIHAQPGLPPLPFRCTMAAARSPENAPATPLSLAPRRAQAVLTAQGRRAEEHCDAELKLRTALEVSLGSSPEGQTAHRV